MKRHERLLNLRIIDPRPAIFDVQQHRLSVTMQADGDDPPAAYSESRYPADSRTARSTKRRLRRWSPSRFPLITEIDSFAPRLLKTGKAAMVNDLLKVYRRERLFPCSFRLMVASCSRRSVSRIVLLSVPLIAARLSRHSRGSPLASATEA